MTTQTDNATPKPWKVTDYAKDGESYHIDGDGNTLAEVFSEANAELIVRAVNAQDELVKALETLVDHAQEAYPHFESERGQRDIKRALDALNKAQGN